MGTSRNYCSLLMWEVTDHMKKQQQIMAIYWYFITTFVLVLVPPQVQTEKGFDFKASVCTILMLGSLEGSIEYAAKFQRLKRRELNMVSRSTFGSCTLRFVGISQATTLRYQNLIPQPGHYFHGIIKSGSLRIVDETSLWFAGLVTKKTNVSGKS